MRQKLRGLAPNKGTQFDLLPYPRRVLCCARGRPYFIPPFRLLFLLMLGFISYWGGSVAQVLFALEANRIVFDSSTSTYSSNNDSSNVGRSGIFRGRLEVAFLAF